MDGKRRTDKHNCVERGGGEIIRRNGPDWSKPKYNEREGTRDMWERHREIEGKGGETERAI